MEIEGQGPATAKARQITCPDIAVPPVPKHAPTAPERTISGGQPIHPKLIKGMIAQQGAAESFLHALHAFGEMLIGRHPAR